MIDVEFDAKELFNSIPNRISVRNYKKESLSKADYDYLVSKTEYINSLNTGVKAYLVNQKEEDVFTGIIGSYGKIKNAPSYFMLVGDTLNKNIDAIIGYIGEYLVLECQNRNIGTCWVAGTFKKSRLSNQVKINSNEKIFCIIAVGYKDDNAVDYAKKMLKAKNRKPLQKLVINYDELSNMPDYIKKSIEYARIAPSAINRQPWRFKVYQNGIDVLMGKGMINSQKLVESKKLDLGIALFHIVVVLKYYDIKFKVSFGEDVFAKITL